MDADHRHITLSIRVAELESENRKLRAEKSSTHTPRKVRGVLATVLISASLLLAPVAVIGTWTQVQLVDTDRFVETFGPLAEDPAVQAFVSQQISGAVEDAVDIDRLVSDMIAGIATLPLPDRAESALSALEGPAAAGIRSVLQSSVDRIVESPRFANLWAATLRETHQRAIAVLQGAPDTAFELSDSGVLSLRLDEATRQISAELADRGIGIAENMPEIDRSVPLLTSDALVTTRVVYQTATLAGHWLPWVVLALWAGGIALAPAHRRALVWAGGGLTITFLLLAGGLGIGRWGFVSSVSPSLMPAPVAHAIYEQLTASMASTSVALAFLGAVITFGAWLTGSARSARMLRLSTSSACASIRAAAAKRGITTGRFGRLVDRSRSGILAVAVVGSVVALFVSRPITVSAVFTSIAVLAGVMVAVELIRRPSDPADPSPSTDPSAAAEETAPEPSP